MAITDAQYQRLLGRVTALENYVNDLSVALDKFVTLEQVNGLHTILETEHDAIIDRVVAVENRVELIENEPLSY